MLSITSPVQDVKPSFGKSLVNHDLQITSVMGAEGQNRSKAGITCHPCVLPTKPLSFKSVWELLWGYSVPSFNKNSIEVGRVARCTNAASAKQNIHSTDIYRDPAVH